MSTAYTDLTVWDDETGERYFVDGHVSNRRAIAAVNRCVRDTCGHASRKEQLGDVHLVDVSVAHPWVRPDPQSPTDDETATWCGPDHHQAEAVTVVSLC